MPPLSCIPIKSNQYIVNSLATVLSEPDLYRLLTFHMKNLMSLFHCLHIPQDQPMSGALWNRSQHGNFLFFAPCPTLKLENHPLSVVCDCLFNTFTATLHTGSHSSISNLRTCHATVTGTPTTTCQILPYLQNAREDKMYLSKSKTTP